MEVVVTVLAIIGGFALALACFIIGRASLGVELAKAAQGGWQGRKPQLLVTARFYIVPEDEYRTIVLLPEKTAAALGAQSVTVTEDRPPPTLVVPPAQPSNIVPFKKE